MRSNHEQLKVEIAIEREQLECEGHRVVSKKRANAARRGCMSEVVTGGGKAAADSG